jgi:hypothetical protein
MNSSCWRVRGAGFLAWLVFFVVPAGVYAQPGPKTQKPREVSVKLGPYLEAVAVDFRQWKPGTPRWMGVGELDKPFDSYSPWKLDGQSELRSVFSGSREGEGSSVQPLLKLPGASAPTVPGSKFTMRVIKPRATNARFVEVVVLFRNKEPKPLTFTTISQAGQGIGMELVLPDKTQRTPVDFLLPGTIPARKIRAFEQSGLTVTSSLSIAEGGRLGFELDHDEDTCALLLFEVPNDVGPFRLAIKGDKVLDLGNPKEARAATEQRVLPAPAKGG